MLWSSYVLFLFFFFLCCCYTLSESSLNEINHGIPFVFLLLVECAPLLVWVDINKGGNGSREDAVYLHKHSATMFSGSWCQQAPLGSWHTKQQHSAPIRAGRGLEQDPCVLKLLGNLVAKHWQIFY